jgi:hypothetical protein
LTGNLSPLGYPTNQKLVLHHGQFVLVFSSSQRFPKKSNAVKRHIYQMYACLFKNITEYYIIVNKLYFEKSVPAGSGALRLPISRRGLIAIGSIKIKPVTAVAMELPNFVGSLLRLRFYLQKSFA